MYNSWGPQYPVGPSESEAKTCTPYAVLLCTIPLKLSILSYWLFWDWTGGTYGTRSLTLDLGLRRTFRWVFIIANVKKPILGADFIHNFGLLVDVRHNRLSDTVTQLKVQGIVSHTRLPDNPGTNSQLSCPNFQQ